MKLTSERRMAISCSVVMGGNLTFPMSPSTLSPYFCQMRCVTCCHELLHTVRPRTHLQGFRVLHDDVLFRLHIVIEKQHILGGTLIEAVVARSRRTKVLLNGDMGGKQGALSKEQMRPTTHTYLVAPDTDQRRKLL
eukprot:54726-Eustigmatos_ZCMA.PRE.3